jgi:hypothetical protein
MTCTVHLDVDGEILAAREPCYPQDANVLASTVLLVGESNPYGADPEFALYSRPNGCSGHRLQSRILELQEEQYLAIWRTNLCVGDWNLQAARLRASQLVSDSAPWRCVIMLGSKVASAFTYQRGILTSGAIATAARRFRVAHLPHPSGRNARFHDERCIETTRSLFWTVVVGDTSARRSRNLVAPIEET